MPILIEKEDIPKYRIVPAFVDRTEEWKQALQYAVRLGNEFKGKTKITFETSQGPKTVETTIWSITEEYLQLKAGLLIPLKSIIEVKHS